MPALTRRPRVAPAEQASSLATASRLAPAQPNRAATPYPAVLSSLARVPAWSRTSQAPAAWFVGSARLQAQLEIGAADDPLEHEADVVAEQVLRMPDPAAQPPSLSRTSPGAVQRACACGGSGAGECAACAARSMQLKASQPAAGAGAEAPGIVHQALGSPGAPLTPPVRSFMEPRFGVDLGGVRVHTDAQAAESARAVGALAYTVGRDVVFGAGQYAPGTAAGQRLLAHELTHVVQQSAAAPGGARLNGAFLQRQPVGLGESRELRPSPFFLAAMGALTVDGFPLDSAELNDDQRSRIQSHARMLLILFDSDPGATIEVIGHTDATGTEEHNLTLGTARAEAVRDELVAAGVPTEKISVESAGKSQLLVDTPGPEPRNRRGQVKLVPSLTLRFPGVPGLGGPFLQPPSLLPPGATPPGEGPTPPAEGRAPPPDITRPNICVVYPPACEPGGGEGGPEYRPELWREIPPLPREPDALRQFFERDPLLRLLPKWLRDKAIGGLIDGPESAADAAVDQIESLDGTTKNAIKATLKALYRTLRGQRWTPPTPPLHPLPPSGAPPYQPAPGERTFTLPPFSF